MTGKLCLFPDHLVSRIFLPARSLDSSGRPPIIQTFFPGLGSSFRLILHILTDQFQPLADGLGRVVHALTQLFVGFPQLRLHFCFGLLQSRQDFGKIQSRLDRNHGVVDKRHADRAVQNSQQNKGHRHHHLF